MPPIFYLLLLLGQHSLARVLTHDHMDQDQDLQEDHSSKANLRGLISGDPYAINPSLHEEVKPIKENETTEKVVEVDVTKQYGIGVTKDYGIEAYKGIDLVAIQVGEGADENIIEMDVAMMGRVAKYHRYGRYICVEFSALFLPEVPTYPNFVRFKS